VQSKLNLLLNLSTKIPISLNVKLLQDILTPLPVQPPSALIQMAKLKGVIYFSILSGIIFFPFL
jgi:hypothetical protein